MIVIPALTRGMFTFRNAVYGNKYESSPFLFVIGLCLHQIYQAFSSGIVQVWAFQAFFTFVNDFCCFNISYSVLSFVLEFYWGCDGCFYSRDPLDFYAVLCSCR